MPRKTKYYDPFKHTWAKDSDKSNAARFMVTQINVMEIQPELSTETGVSMDCQSHKPKPMSNRQAIALILSFVIFMAGFIGYVDYKEKHTPLVMMDAAGVQ